MVWSPCLPGGTGKILLIKVPLAPALPVAISLSSYLTDILALGVKPVPPTIRGCPTAPVVWLMLRGVVEGAGAGAGAGVGAGAGAGAGVGAGVGVVTLKVTLAVLLPAVT